MSPCPHPPLLPAIKPKTVTLMNSVLIWAPTPQLPLNPLTGIRTVFVNNLYPIVDQDMLTPHPTPTQLTTTSIGYQCATTVNTPGWWCTKGIAGAEKHLQDTRENCLLPVSQFGSMGVVQGVLVTLWVTFQSPFHALQ